MAHCGMRHLGWTTKKTEKNQVFLECDRCPATRSPSPRAADRQTNLENHGLRKNCGRFVDLSTGRAVRVSRKKRIHPADGEV
jgi:hypothetical protein